MTTPKRIALMGFFLESNNFAPVSDEAAFRSLCYLAGSEILDDMALENPSLPIEINAFADNMNNAGIEWEPVPILVTGSEPGGPIDHAFFKTTVAEMERRLREAMPLDGVYCAAHGAMTSTEEHDPDGEVFEMIRRVVGADTPVLATLDLHTNISERMVETTDCLLAYLTNPHVDQAARAQEAANLMRDMFAGLKTEKAFIRLPICPPSVTLLTEDGPYGDLIDYGQQTKSSEIVNVSVTAGFVFSDTPKNGISVIVTSRGGVSPARKLALDIAKRGWADRERYKIKLTSLEETVEMVLANGQDTTRPAQIFADVADNPGGGGRGNTTWILRELVDAGAQGVYFGNFIDADLAEAAWTQGEGATFEAVFNAAGETEYSKKFKATVTVLKVSDGQCIGRRGIFRGRSISIGRSALLQVGGVKVVVASKRKQCADPIFFEMFGLNVAEARSVIVKSRGHFRAGFDETFAPDQVLEVDVKGLTSPVLSNFEFKGLPRPVYPLDAETTWSPPDW